MNNWNYRVIKTYCKDTDEYIYGIHAVYYDKPDKPNNVTIDPISVTGESMDDLKWILDKFKEALEKPILKMEYFDSDKDNNQTKL